MNTYTKDMVNLVNQIKKYHEHTNAIEMHNNKIKIRSNAAALLKAQIKENIKNQNLDIRVDEDMQIIHQLDTRYKSLTVTLTI